MNRFKNILVVWTDTVGCDDAIEQATALALANEANLTIAADSGSRTTLRWQHELHKRLERISRSIDRIAGLPVTTEVLRGARTDSIIQKVLENGHDLVLVSSEIGTSSPFAMLGSAKRKLMKNCPCPVWFLSPGQQVPYKRVLAVVDPCLKDETDLPLNRKILEIATSLAARHGAALDLVHAWDIEGPDHDKVRSEERVEERARLIDVHKTERRKALEALVRSIRPEGAVVDIHLPRTSPSVAIRELAQKNDADVIVMHSGGGFNLPFLPGDSLIEALQDTLRCSVLSITRDRLAEPRAAARKTAAEIGRKAAA